MFRTALCMLLLAAAPLAVVAQDELSEAFKALKAADEQKDNALVKKTAIESIHLSNIVLKTAKPAEESDAAVWNASQAFGKEVKAYAEYALDTAILRTADPQQRVDLFETFEKEIPDSHYLPSLYGTALAAYAKLKPDKSYGFAQRIIAKDANNEDLLLVLAAGAYERKQYDATVNYSNRMLKVMSVHARPEGFSNSDWESKRTAMLGRGHWFSGMSYAAQNKHPQAVESLKASLPFIKGEPQLTAGAHFFIGLADYNLARATHEKSVMQEALKYSDLAAQSGTAYSKQASQNAYAIKNELAKMR